MKTSIDLDPDLISRALALSERKTKKEVVHEALELFVIIKQRKNLSDLKGKIEFRSGYNHKSHRGSVAKAR